MHTARARLSVREYLFLGLVIAFWAGFVVFLGKDTSWDFRNYHWYAPYAFLNHRMDLDVAVAHLASYYNPFLDIPFYLLATHLPSWAALAILGAVQGCNVVPLYLMARSALRLGDASRLGAGVLALLGGTGALTLSLYGTTYYDNVMSVFVLSGLAILVVNRDALREGPPLRAALLAGLAGFITGCAVGLKLPEAPFAIGFAAALLALGGSVKQQSVRLLAGGLAGAAGFALFSAWWMLHIQALTGNPLFPYFNEYFHSSLALPATYRDLRFVPTHIWDEVFFPLLFTINWHIADDLGFHDIRVCVAYFAIIAALLLWALRRRSADPLIEPRAALVLFAFAGVSYFVWLKIFAIYRYIVALEMLAPLLIVTAVGLFPLSRRVRYILLAAICLAVLVTSRSDFAPRAPLGDPYIRVALPPISDPDHVMVLMTGDAPLGFIVPSLPHQIPVLRIDGWMVQPRDGSGLTRLMRRRVAAHLAAHEPLYLISSATDMARARRAVADYNLAIRWTGCRQFDTNLVGIYEWCPLQRRP